MPIKSKKFRSNWDLSTARAVEVLNFMIGARHGVRSASRRRATPISLRSPPTTRPENKAKNRRIEITLVPNLDDLPPIDDALKENKDAKNSKETAATP